ncbi:class I SAM-dependent DNA methyltransferase [Burkholderia ubonensis]|uniref:HsdM family class I SAM-dependent methyltransferase n=1 Tax=Burkholderia ubonensis TaxID=101571 RepID=UPI0009B3C55A|nr:N-6 DNA methylase [Burkholderia ubonensis]
MKGHVPTPDMLVDEMVERLFAGNRPHENDQLLDPGCGGGAFIAGVLRWCTANGAKPPKITGVELNPSLAAKARKRFVDYPSVKIVHADYLGSALGQAFRFVIGNPPYVSLGKLGGEAQRDRYRARFVSARGRFDLYMLFFERALEDLAENGRLVFITPEKFLYVASAEPLRRLLVAQSNVSAIDLAPENVFPGFTTYPAVTTLDKGRGTDGLTSVQLRCGTARLLSVPTDGQSWWPRLMGEDVQHASAVLGDICVRVSAGIATGADGVYVRDIDSMPTQLRAFAKPAIAGKDLTLETSTPAPRRAILVPYADNGTLLSSEKLGSLGAYLSESDNEKTLKRRTCVRRKPWYAFHDNYPVDILRPKIIFKDITKSPRFWIDRTGGIIPLHSVYYIVPKQVDQLDALCDWLNGDEAGRWLAANCQRAANGYLRLQSAVLRRLPVPEAIFSNVILEEEITL